MARLLLEDFNPKIPEINPIKPIKKLNWGVILAAPTLLHPPSLQAVTHISPWSIEHKIKECSHPRERIKIQTIPNQKEIVANPLRSGFGG
ncbi:hypothetical protein ACFL06_01395 [Patescibacteria group bacterium]